MSRNLYEQVWGTLPFPSFVVDTDDTIAAVNPPAEQLTRMSQNSLLKKPIDQIFGEHSIIMDTIRQARTTNSSVTQYGVEVGNAEMRALPCNLHLNFLDLDTKEILILIQPTGVAQKMSRSLTNMTAARSVGAMAATLAHEIRNPLAGIKGAAQLLAMNAEPADVELAEMIDQEARRISGLVDRVEHFGDMRPTVREQVNIHDVIDRAIRAAQAGYSKDVVFNKEYDPSLPDAAGEADQLLQVFQNLIKNATEAMPNQKGSIKIRTSYSSGVKFAVSGGSTESLPLQVEITDDGAGIPSELVKEIFEPFVSSKVNGTGLGLSLVSKIVSAHGGLVEVQSAPQKTTFTLRLPIWQGKRTS